MFTTQLLNALQRTNTYLNIYYYPGLWSHTSSATPFHLLRDPRNRWVSRPVLRAGTRGSASSPREPRSGSPLSPRGFCAFEIRSRSMPESAAGRAGCADLLLGLFAPLSDTARPGFQTGAVPTVSSAGASCHPPWEPARRMLSAFPLHRGRNPAPWDVSTAAAQARPSAPPSGVSPESLSSRGTNRGMQECGRGARKGTDTGMRATRAWAQAGCPGAGQSVASFPRPAGEFAVNAAG